MALSVAVQVAGDPLDAEDYVRWRERKLRRGAITAEPEPATGHYALVLFAIDPSTTEQFIAHGAARHLTPPRVGQFKPTVEATGRAADHLEGRRRNTREGYHGFG